MGVSHTSRFARCAAFALGFALTLAAGVATASADTDVRGLPFSRSYSLEDVGYVPRSARLNFDSFGRIAVIHEGVYSVLNDTAWFNIADPTESTRTPMMEVVHAGYGQTFYGGRSSWGMAELGVDGKLHAKPLVPRDPPAWVRTTTFEEIIVTTEGVYFISVNGVAYWDFLKKESQLFEFAERPLRVFSVGKKVFVSWPERGLRVIDTAQRRLQPVPDTVLNQVAVDRAAVLDGTRSLISTPDGSLFVFDGQAVTPWDGPAREGISGRVSVLHHLADGNVAMAITGKGVFVLSPEGALLSALTTPQYHRITSIASREAGVMWLLTEESVEKVLYAGGLTSFGQRLGLTLGFPLIAAFEGRIFVTSDGILYEAKPGATGGPARFERMAEQPLGGAWALTAGGGHLLVGSPRGGVYEVARDGTLKQIATVGGLRHLAMIGDNLCYVIGAGEIAALDWDGQRWTETTPRVPGLPRTYNLQRTATAAWVEMGADGVARISRKDGALKVMVLRNEPWTQALWVNIGVVGDLAVLSTIRDQRRFFDERTETWREMPEFKRLLDSAPRWIARVWMDEVGTLWATHSEGLVRFTPNGDGYEMDLSTYDFVNDRYPLVYILPGNDVWATASRSLHHVEPLQKPKVLAPPKPVLVSLMDSRRNVELLPPRLATAAPLQLAYAQNSLTFRFFSGSYAWRRAPVYEFRLKADEPWAPLESGALLRLPALHEGSYHLEVRAAGDSLAQGAAMVFPFEVLPPWHRTWPAYFLYVIVVLAAILGINRWSVRLASRRNRALEAIVQQRTGELESAMVKLNEETRVSATLAERDRVAGEIHDSVQQGLSGAIIQLDTTLRLPLVRSDVLARLQVIRNMIAYARQEVQHAVWDMDSPLLEHNDLGEALRKLATFTMSSNLVPTVVVAGNPIPLPRTLTHHLLRIAQEAMTNAVRHAQAHHVNLELEYRADAVALRISDDGIGFNAAEVLNKPGHFGVRGIQGRAKKLNAELAVTSSPGHGTVIRVIAPLPQTN